MGYVLVVAYQPWSSGSGPRGGLVAVVLNDRMEYLVDVDDVDSSLTCSARRLDDIVWREFQNKNVVVKRLRNL